MGELEFSKDEMNQMSGKLSTIASAVTGTKVNGLKSTINSHVPFMGTCLKDYMRHWVTKSNKAAYQKNHNITFEEQGIYNSTVEKLTNY